MRVMFLVKSTIQRMYLDRTPSLIYNVLRLGGKGTRSVPSRAFSPESRFSGRPSSLPKPFPVYSLAASLVTITKQTPYKSFVLTSFRIPRASTSCFSITSTHSVKNRGVGVPLLPDFNRHFKLASRSSSNARRPPASAHRRSPLTTRHSPLLCATLPSQRKRLCDPHVPASRSSSSSFSSAHRTGMRVRWRPCGSIDPAEPNPQLPNAKEGR